MNKRFYYLSDPNFGPAVKKRQRYTGLYFYVFLLLETGPEFFCKTPGVMTLPSGKKRYNIGVDLNTAKLTSQYKRNELYVMETSKFEIKDDDIFCASIIKALQNDHDVWYPPAGFNRGRLKST